MRGSGRLQGAPGHLGGDGEGGEFELQVLFMDGLCWEEILLPAGSRQAAELRMRHTGDGTCGHATDMVLP